MKRKAILGVWSLIALVLILYLSNALVMKSDMSFFLAKNISITEKILQEQLNNNEASRLVFITLTANETNKAAEVNKKIQAKLSNQITTILKQENEFNSVENGGSNNSAFMFPQLYKYRYLLRHADNDKTDIFSKEYLTEKFINLKNRLQILLTPGEQQLMSEDPINVWIDLIKSWQTNKIQRDYGVWFNQNNNAIILLKTKASGFNLDEQEKNLNKINTVLESHLPSDVSHTISGVPVIGVATRHAISFQIKVISIIASFFLAAFVYWVFHSIKIVILIFLPLGFAVIAGLTMVNLTYGYVHGIALAFGITIIGVAIDYPIHYFIYTGVKKGHTSQQSIQVHTHLWSKIYMGLFTTIIGFSAIIFSSFPGLNQLGLFSICGLLAAVLVCRYLLPYFSFKSEINIGNKLSLVPDALISGNLCLYRYILLFVIVLSLIFIMKNNNILQNDISTLSPVNTQAQSQDFEFRKSLNMPELRFVLFIQALSEQQALEQSEVLLEKLDGLIKHNVITAYDVAARYLPSIKKQRQNQQKLPDKQQLENYLQEILQPLNLNYNIFMPFINAVELNKTAIPLSYKDLQDPLILSKINPLLYQISAGNKHHKKWIALIPLMGVDPELMSQVSFSGHEMAVKLIDIKKTSDSMLEKYTHDAIKWFTGGSLLIMVFVLIYTRQIKKIHQLLLPFSAATILTIAILLLSGSGLSIFHVVTLLLVVGLGIDYSLFIQNNISADSLLKQPYKEIYPMIKTGIFSVFVCTVSTFIMFSSLAFSSIPVLRAIGLTAATGSLIAFIMSLILSRPCK